MEAEMELEQMEDAELNRLFAVEVAGWEGETEAVPDYCLNASLVLPWMDCGLAECYRHTRKEGAEREWYVAVWPDDGERGFGSAPTFARAAVIALLKAKRGEA